jgi:gluconokinase
MGAAMVGLTSMDVYDDLKSSLEIAPTRKDLNPNAAKNKTYAKYYSLFERLTHKFESEFEEIAKLQNDY